jgi:RNA polymerase sigma-70 factor, ECF subfamily
VSYDLGDQAAPDADEADASTSAAEHAPLSAAASSSGRSSLSACEASASAGRRRARAWHVPRHRRAFHRFYREHFGLVWSMVRRFGVPSAQHEDAVQEVWLVAYRRLHTLEPDASAKAWLSSITRRVASRLRRTEDRQRRKLAALGVATDRPRLALGAVDVQDARRLIDALLAELDDDQRDVLLLAQVHGLSGPEIAQVLEIPLNTAYSRLRLARRRIERFAAEVGSEEAAVIRELRRTEEPPPRAAAQAWLLLLPELGVPVAGAGTAASTGLLGGISGVKAFVVAVSVGVVGLVVARSVVDARASRASEPLAVVAAASDAGVVVDELGARAEPVPSRAPDVVLPVGSDGEAAPRRASSPRLPGVSVAIRGSADSASASSSPSSPVDEASLSPRVADPASLTAEAELLGRAQRSLRAGDAAAALRLLDEHERRFPAGELGDERRGARVRALCELGRGAQARAEAQRLQSERPHSPVAAGVADVCS